MEGKIFEYLEKYNYENLYFFNDNQTGIKGVICIHDTTLGPATGGCRMWTYANEWDAIEDALRLGRGMTYKYAAAGVELGGGKAVIIGDPKTQKSEALFRSFGRFLNRLNGTYITGQDVGTTLRDMETIRLETPYVVTLPREFGGAGEISPYTALSTFQSMKACAKEKLGTDSLKDVSVSVQGVGSVGYHLVKLLADEGANITIADIDEKRVKEVSEEFHTRTAKVDEIDSLEVEIFSPCALGKVINDQSLTRLKCQIVAGSANNQLTEERHGDHLDEMGILYAPDYIANSGGTIFDTDRIKPGGFNQERGINSVKRVYETMTELIAISKNESIPTYKAADLLAERRISSVGKAKQLRRQFDVLT
ncbi:Glu/Leu/Phe/Val dehydrogenase dimerization domain-containing protein [Bacillus sp. MRMR6]|uniref:Leu/Phe/Val dehydrogenase n=1 Tax=Bacillus sp. MRMR6 TaxID=1928617 RepID=UPI000952373D|nr:Glu/Leu/Phe/Val dehydrogenase dimerization domain-containing protein [Bacillus sp. MRMR6]OLS34506.1 leucine dehydrogenase [Bacillus sp. MRMR6]